jgi:hypothetical protein
MNMLKIEHYSAPLVGEDDYIMSFAVAFESELEALSSHLQSTESNLLN